MSAGHDSLEIVCRDSAPADWDTLLAADPAADYFHTPHWSEAAGRSWPGVKPFWLCARQAGRLVGGMAAVRHTGRVARLESGLDGTSGGPLLDPTLEPARQETVFTSLLAAYLKERQGALPAVCLTFNAQHEARYGRLMRNHPEPWQRSENPGAVVPLEGGPEQVAMTRMVGNKRNERNRALRRGVSATAGNDPALLRAYYPFFEEACAVWGKVPTPLAFLEDLLRDRQRVYFVSVIHEGQMLGGHLNLLYGGRAVAWNGVTDRRHARTLFPGTMSVWGDVVAGCERGARILDLGGSGGVVSLERFKKYFGAETEERGHYVLEPASLKLLRGGKKILNRFRSADGGRRWHDEAAAADNATDTDNATDIGADS
ncbi:hypothetical protein CSA17_05035 [bacterium DOLJORAL78_65_58]|nr:MAG: hypothetical protein CSB20_02530 [bacterium DOLZORAL124_64_63]PIE75900.1 MAG: hypothetical protein CSA17_05035 [bacterium DOLJORAL78_65_58]